MQIIKDAITPARLDQVRKMLEQEEVPSSEQKAESLDAKLRRVSDLEAEIADQEAFAKKHRESVR